jgi:formylglycine-generating enzyme required for sulfatase activity
LWLGKVTGLPFGLPTEAQWEYAASNGENNAHRPFPTPTGLLEKDKTHPSFKRKKELLGRWGALYPVGLFAPSPAGLYDLVGNGFDWVNDWYAPDAYVRSDSHNPKGPETGTEKVLRGKSVNDDMVSSFPHLDRYHKDPESDKLDDEPFPYIWESFRCAINQDKPLAGR